MRIVFIATAWMALVADASHGADYHFSALGSDAFGNGSLASPWQSISKLNTLNLEPGDNVLLRAGDTFAGNILLDANDSANSPTGIFGGSPITLASYGLGNRPIISSPSGHGLRVLNAGGLEIHGLEFAGTNMLNSITNVSNTTKGLFFENSQTSFQQQHIVFDDLFVHGFGEAGINLHATNPTINSGGFANVQITNSDIYQNGRSGISTSVSSSTGFVIGGSAYDYYSRAHADIHVADNVVRGTTGKNQTGGVSGNGIVLAQVNGATIERNVAHHNGGIAGGGGVGIWAWEGDHVVIQFNEAYANQTFDGRDGGGFDLDGGVRDSVMQYNYSHGNEGAGLGLFQFSYASDMGGNTIRYNISEADGTGISVWGNGPRYPGTDAAEDSIYHNNTVINPSGPAIHFFGVVDDVGLYNNILVTSDGRPLVKLEDWDGSGNDYTIDVDMRSNAYWSSGDPFLVQWAHANYSSLVTWANATGQEKIAGTMVGQQVDPQLVGPFTGGVTLDDPTLLSSLSTYRLLGTSPLVDGGSDLGTLPLAIALGLTDAGLRDFFGGTIPARNALDIGAHELPIAGDYNANGFVDAADYTVWRDTLEQTGAGLTADGNGNNQIELMDYTLWMLQFGISPGMARSPIRVLHVPEPPSIRLLAFVAFLATRAGKAPSHRHVRLCKRVGC